MRMIESVCQRPFGINPACNPKPDGLKGNSESKEKRMQYSGLGGRCKLILYSTFDIHQLALERH